MMQQGSDHRSRKHVVVLGGGLAGLSCAYEVAKAGHQVTVLEREPHVGGMASSWEDGDVATAGRADSDYFTHDFGPHRFHTDEVELLRHVKEILGENQVLAQRLSRIYMDGKFYSYPIEAGNVLRNMPWYRIAAVLFDYAWTRFCDVTRIRRYRDANFQEWVERRFGKILSRMFFVEYTEKTWGMPATEISADWASQRISLLNLRDTVVKALRPSGAEETPRTLVSEFVYPRTGGIGSLARGYAREIERLGGRIMTDSPAIRVHREGMKVTHVEFRIRGGGSEIITGDEYLSTIPVTAMARCVTPKPPQEVVAATKGLDHVAIVFVYLKINRPRVSHDNWIYLPQKNLTIHRISEFKNFSSDCAPAGKTLICAEITCRVGDHIWKADLDELRQIAVGDLVRVGLLDEHDDVFDTFTKKIPFAYPIYDLDYASHLQVVMDFVHSLENLRSGGRQGLFRYNNMDQSIEMGRRVAEALATGREADHEAVATEQELFEYGEVREVASEVAVEARS